MKNYNVELLPIAQSDMSETYDYITEILCAPEAAIHLLDMFIAAFEQLEKLPLSGTTLETNIPLKHSYRWVLVENYYIFHTVNTFDETVTIMRIIYAKSNYIKILK